MRDVASILPLHVENVRYIVDGKLLLDDVSFVLPKGQVVAIIGPNGAGKSLTLRLCHGMLQPTAGQISWQRSDATARRHGMVFQRPVMLRRSVRGNIEHALNAAGSGRRTVEDALERFGLHALADQPARLLSGGEQQRVAIARAWVLEPEVLFLDEPTAHLDPGATRQIESHIATLTDEGVTIVLATHDFGQARRLAGRILFFHRGRLIEDAQAAEFFSNPSTKEAKAFLSGDILW